MNITRELASPVSIDLERRMVFIGGPRQVGKTTLARSFISSDEQYLTWDNLHDRKKIKDQLIDPGLGVVVLDEIHRYARWRTVLKGLFDKYHRHLKILVTGSARLDHFRKGGDSLFGRYAYHRLHPFSLPEVRRYFPTEPLVDRLLQFGGFPEPFLSTDPILWRRWQTERRSRVVYQDVNDLSLVREISLIQMLADLLPQKVGSLLSIKSLQEDLEVSPNSVARWVEILEQVYYCYRIYPYGPKKIRAVRKAAKLYLWDWSEVENEGARWENFVAGHLLKYCHNREDREGIKMELRYLRDIDGREIDFVVLAEGKPLFAVECKTQSASLSPHLFYYRDRTPIPRFYQIHRGTEVRVDGNIEALPFEEFCRREQLP